MYGVKCWVKRGLVMGFMCMGISDEVMRRMVIDWAKGVYGGGVYEG